MESFHRPFEFLESLFHARFFQLVDHQLFDSVARHLLDRRLVDHQVFRPFFPERRERRIVGDPVEPGGEAAISLERPEALEGLEESVLGQLFGVFRIANDLEDERVNRFSVTIDEAGEAGGVARQHPLYVICIAVQFHRT